MVAPLWDLPVSRRGVLPLTAREVNAIFDVAYVTEFETVVEERVARMTAPLFGAKGASGEQKSLMLG
jgi:hypothetical protein